MTVRCRSTAWAWVMLAVLASGCGNADLGQGAPTTEAAANLCAAARLDGDDLSAAAATVGEAVCTSLADPAAQVLENEPITALDLTKQINAFCALGAPASNLDSSIRQMRTQLDYRAVSDPALAGRWQQAGLITEQSLDSAGRTSVEFDERRLAHLARLQMGIDQVMFDNQRDLCGR